MNEAIALVELLKAELEDLKGSQPDLDHHLLNQMHTALSTDIHLDELFGTNITEPHVTAEGVLDSTIGGSPEIQAFLSAGFRAFAKLEQGLHAP